jgi:REP element-mobilizing transposase RayT
MPYCQLFYHVVWATKHREPRITSEIEPIIYTLWRTKAIGLGGTVFALNGGVEHVHLVTTIPPRIAVATFVGQVKGVASAKLNQSQPSATPFYWQEEYGAFSFDGKRLPNVIAYVENQKQHHAQQSTIPILERTEGEDVRLVKEPTIGYLVEEEKWRQEMLALSTELDRLP